MSWDFYFKTVMKGIDAVVGKVKKCGLQSVAFPTFGCGSGTPPEELADCFVEVSEKYPQIEVQFILHMSQDFICECTYPLNCFSNHML